MAAGAARPARRRSSSRSRRAVAGAHDAAASPSWSARTRCARDAARGAGGPAQGGAAARRLAHHRRAPTRRGCRRATRSPSIATRSRALVTTRAGARSQRAHRAAAGRGAAGGGRAGDRRRRSARRRRRWRRASARLCGDRFYFYDAIAPIVEADSIDWAHAFRGSRWGRGSDDGGDYVNCPMTKDEYRAFVAARARRAEGRAARLRGAALLRGLPADRGHGRARRRGARLRPDEAGRPRHRRASGGRAAARGEPLGHQLQPGRLPDAADLPRAEAHLRHDPGARERRVRAHGIDPPQLLRRVLAPARQPSSSCARCRDVRLAGQITGVEGYIESTAMGLVAALFTHGRARRPARCRRRRRPPRWARSTSTSCARGHRASRSRRPTSTSACCRRSRRGPRSASVGRSTPSGRRRRWSRGWRRRLTERATPAPSPEDADRDRERRPAPARA